MILVIVKYEWVFFKGLVGVGDLESLGFFLVGEVWELYVFMKFVYIVLGFWLILEGVDRSF